MAIQPQILTVDLSGRGGLAPRSLGDRVNDPRPQLRYLAGETQMVSGFFDPIKRYGYMSPVSADLTTITLGGGTPPGITSATYSDIENENIYIANGDRYLFRGNFAVTDLPQLVDLEATGSPRITDLEMYQVNQVRKIFVVYVKSNNLHIGIGNPTSTFSFDAAWFTSTASGATTIGVGTDLNVRPFMVTADNSLAYVFHDNFVHSLNGTSTGGTNGTITPNVLIFPASYRIIDAVDYRGNLYIAIQDTLSDLCGVYIWNRQTSQFTTEDFIPIKGVRLILRIYVAHNGSLRIIAKTIRQMTQIRQFTGSTFETIADIERPLSLGFDFYRDCLNVTDSYTLFTLSPTGKFILHGSIVPGEPEILVQLFENNQKGAFAVHNFGFILLSRESPNQIQRHILHSFGNTTHSGNVFTPVRKLTNLSIINYARVYCAPTFATGTNQIASIKVYLNQSTTAQQEFPITRNDTQDGFIFIPIGKTNVHTIQFEIIFNDATESNTFLASHLELSYTPTGKVK